MPIFEWKEEYANGVEPMDQNHREVLRLALDLETAVGTNAVRADLLQKFDLAFEAIQSGMVQEEVLLKQAAYPAFRFHKREHDDLLQILIEYREKVVEGSASICLSSLGFLGGWLVSHFKSEDRCACQFLLQLARAS